MSLDLVFERQSKNKLNVDTTKKKLRELAAIAQRHPAYGFSGKVSKIVGPEPMPDEGYRYKVKLRVEKHGRIQSDVDQVRLQKILMEMGKKATLDGWRLVEEKEPSFSVQSEQEEEQVKPKAKFNLPKLTPDIYKSFFSGVYERDAHIRTIHSAVTTRQESNGEILSHVLLHGQPGACKTKLTEKFKAWYEQDGEDGRVLFVDGTTMTKAGLENWLLELADRGRLPDVLVVDELEKQPMDNLLCLNGIMGSGMLSKLNARVSNTRIPANFVVIGICNDKEALRAFRNGALWSRFTHKLGCVRPSRELSLRILKEVTTVLPNGKPIWAEKAMEFGWDELGQRDIRQIKGHLDGRERLLDGSWQSDQRAIINAEVKENEQLEQEK